MPFATVDGVALEYQWAGQGDGAAADTAAPTVVMLHEGLGSVALWRDFPAAVHHATGLPVLVYSRRGYGRSAPIEHGPRPIDYMNGEARVALPGLLRQLGVARPILLGHSDGGSIALIYAGSGLDPAPLGIITMAAHLFVETISTISIAKARVAYEESDLRAKLAKFHDDIDGAFYSWNTTWLLPAFIRGWNIEADVARARCPITAIQGEQDEYGTVRQLDAIRDRSGGRAEIVLLPQCRHSPHRDQRAATLAAIVAHVARVRAGT